MANKLILSGLKKNVGFYVRFVGLQKAAEKTKERLQKNAGLTDHDLEQLAALGHPYSRRYKGPPLHKPDYQVHIQSGKLKDNIKITKEDKDSVAIGVDPLAVPYFLDVVEGNARMVPRDFPFFTLHELIDENIIYNTMEASIKTAVEKS